MPSGGDPNHHYGGSWTRFSIDLNPVLAELHDNWLVESAIVPFADSASPSAPTNVDKRIVSMFQQAFQYSKADIRKEAVSKGKDGNPIGEIAIRGLL